MTNAERLIRLETQFEYMSEKLDRIESKIDSANGSKKILGIPGEVRNFFWKNAIRLGIIYIFGEKIINSLPK